MKIILIIASAVLVGLLHIWPPFFVGQKLKSMDSPFVLLQLENHSDEVHGYIPRAHDIYEGKFPPEPRIFPWLSSALFAGFLFVSGGDINLSYIFANFLFSALAFISFYFLGRFIFNNDLKWSLAFSFIASLTPIATNLAEGLKSPQYFLNIIVKNFYPGVHTPLVRLFLSRIDNPLLTLPFYIFALGLIYLLWVRSSRTRAVLVGLATGLLVYLYFHYWAYLVLVLMLLTLYKLFDKRREILKIWLYLWVVLITISLPYILNYAWLKSNTISDFFQRLGIEHGYAFRFSRWPDYLVYVFFAVLVYFVFWKKQGDTTKNKAKLWWVFLLAMFMVWNIQVILGFQPELKWNRAISPVIYLLVAVSGYQILKQYSKRIIGLFLICLILLIVSKKVVNAELFFNPDSAFLKEHVFNEAIFDSWDWMENKLPKDSVVISASVTTSHYLEVYTSLEPYLKPGLSVRFSNDDLENRFLVASKLFSISPDILESILRRGVAGEDLPGSLYYNYYKNQSFDIDYRNNFDPSLKEWSMPEEKINQLKSRLGDFKMSWQDVSMNYLYLGPFEKKLGLVFLNKETWPILIYKNSEVEIYH